MRREADQLLPVERLILNDFRSHTRLIRRQPADDRSNCHGWVFTAGRYWTSHLKTEASVVWLNPQEHFGQETVAVPGGNGMAFVRSRVRQVQFGAVASIHPGNGIFAFGAAVVLTMLATHAFDPKTIWQA